MLDFKYLVDHLLLQPRAMSYDNKYIEYSIPGYLTLDVMGRESLDVDIQADNIKVGSIVGQQTVGSRVLTISYGIISDGYADSQKKFNKLKVLLYKEEDVPIVFDDEPSVYYYGRIQKITTPEYLEENFVTGSFDIYCPDPRKYSKTKENSLIITTDSPVPTTPEKIILTMTTNSSVKITNQNTGKAVAITGAAIYTGNKVEFDFDKGKIWVNGADKTEILDLASDFENFYIRRGDKLVCSGGKDVKVYVREVYL